MRNEVVIHLPLPFENSNQLLQSLRSNRHFYAQFGVNVPDPKVYRNKLAKYLTSPEDPQITNVGITLLHEKIGGLDNKRTVLSLPNVPNSPDQILSPDGLLPDLNTTVERIFRIFNNHKVIIIIGIINPSSLLTALTQFRSDVKAQPMDLTLAPVQFWSDALGGCIDCFPDLTVAVWKHEAAHYNWSRILRYIGRVPDARPIPGSLDMIVNLLQEDGTAAIRDHMRRMPPQNDYHFEKIIRSYAKNICMHKAQRKVAIAVSSHRIVDAFEKIYTQDIALIKEDKKLILIN